MNKQTKTLSIEGYAARFDAVDNDGDLLVRGAFKNSISPQRTLPMLYQHKVDAPIGQWTQFYEDARGLYIKGEVLLETQLGAETATLIDAGVIDGLSIGYRTLRARKGAGAIKRMISEAMLWEVSIVTFPMAPGARLLARGARLTPSARGSLRVPKPSAAGDPPPARTGERAFDPPPSNARLFSEALYGAARTLSQ